MVWAIVALLAVAAVAGLLAAAWWLRGWPLVAGVACGVLAVAIAIIHVTRAAEARPLDPHPDSELRIATLGDSYISGEGAQSYFPGTDVPGRNACHRAASAHPYLVADELEASLTFVACSGARTADVTGRNADGEAVPGQHPRSDPSVFGARPQIDVLRELDQPDAVLLSIGGNDAGFAEIGIRCASPGAPDCRRSASFWLGRLDKVVYPAIVRAYEAVREAARGAEVFVLTYPNPIGPRLCRDIGLSRAELGFVRNVFVGRLNELIRFAARVARVRVIDVTRSLDGHRLCEKPLSKAAVNFIQLGRTRGTTLDLRFKSLGSLAHGTFHPNPLGHTLLARTVRPQLEALRAGTLPPLPTPLPEGSTPPRFEPEELRRPPVGELGFPEGTRCTGREIAFVSPVAAEADVRFVSLDGVRPRSTVCYRSFQAAWRSTRADPRGAVRVPVELGRAGVGGINEILAELPGGVWKRVVVSRLGAADEAEPPEEPSNVGLYVLLGLLGAAVVTALVLRWISLGRRGRR